MYHPFSKGMRVQAESFLKVHSGICAAKIISVANFGFIPDRRHQEANYTQSIKRDLTVFNISRFEQ